MPCSLPSPEDFPDSWRHLSWHLANVSNAFCRFSKQLLDPQNTMALFTWLRWENSIVFENNHFLKILGKQQNCHTCLGNICLSQNTYHNKFQILSPITVSLCEVTFSLEYMVQFLTTVAHRFLLLSLSVLLNIEKIIAIKMTMLSSKKDREILLWRRKKV